MTLHMTPSESPISGTYLQRTWKTIKQPPTTSDNEFGKHSHLSFR